MSYRNELVQGAQQYIGQEEIQPNLGFKDPAFAAKMNAVGFYKTASWCAFFLMVVAFEVYAKSMWIQRVKKLLSPSTQTTWANFSSSPDFHVSHTPKMGSFAVWKTKEGGHIALVSWFDANSFKAVAGNTNTNGSANGYEVAETSHGYNFYNPDFQLLGFIWLPDTEDLNTVDEYKQGLVS